LEALTTTQGVEVIHMWSCLLCSSATHRCGIASSSAGGCAAAESFYRAGRVAGSVASGWAVLRNGELGAHSWRVMEDPSASQRSKDSCSPDFEQGPSRI